MCWSNKDHRTSPPAPLLETSPSCLGWVWAFLTHIFLLLRPVYFPVGLGSTVSLWQSSWVSSFCMRHVVACCHSEPCGPAGL